MYLAHYVKTWRNPQKWNYTVYCSVIKWTEPRRPQPTGNEYWKFPEVWTCCFWDTRADRQTYIQTYKRSWQYFASLMGRSK